MNHVRTRFAPSPTGYLHVGSLRTALYAYAFAKSKPAGKFILRIEDTDRQRYVPGSVEKIYESLSIFGLNWDEGPLVGGQYAPYIQSERVATGIYQQAAKTLIDQGNAYYCFCPPETKEAIKASQDKKEVILRDPCRNLSFSESKNKISAGQTAAIRLKVPDKEKISFYDFVLKKEITWDSHDIDEVMLLKSDGYPTYHLAVTVDDATMQISHIIRGREWLPSTPVHLLLFKYLGLAVPQIGHMSVILDPDGGKLSKRKGNVSCEQFLQDGYLPEAILNFIMLLGWAPKDNREFFSLQEFVENFNNGNLQTANPVFNRKKLDWFNGYYIRQKTDSELAQLLQKYAPIGMSNTLIQQSVPAVKERLVKLSDYTNLVDFVVNKPQLEKSFLLASTGETPKSLLCQIQASLEVLQQANWQTENLEIKLRELATANTWHLGHFFMGLRISLTGKTISPPFSDTLHLLGQQETLNRLQSTLLLF